MKQLKGDLQAVLKSLKQATARVEKLLKKLDGLEEAQSTKKTKATAGAGPAKARAQKKTTEGDIVLAVIKRFKKGVDLATLRKKTGIEGRKMGDIIYRLKKTGKIKVMGKGFYTKA